MTKILLHVLLLEDLAVSFGLVVFQVEVLHFPDVRTELVYLKTNLENALGRPRLD